jgi:hypothetical protein
VVANGVTNRSPPTNPSERMQAATVVFMTLRSSLLLPSAE